MLAENRSNKSAPVPAIHVEQVSRSFGSVQALVGLDLEVEAGTIFALLGPNGAGKTTLVRVLTTLLRPDTGTVKVGGHDALRDPRSVKMEIGLAGQSAAVDEILTGRENLELVGRLYHLDSLTVRKRADELLESFGLTDAANRPAKTYSGGMRRRLDLAASLVGKPRILFLDEPTTGLDPQSRLDLWAMIQELASKGVTIFLTTQYLEEADYLAGMIAVIDHGRIIAHGTPEALKSRIGGDVVEMRLSDRLVAGEAADLIRKFGSGEPEVKEESGRVVLPVDSGPAVLADVVRELDAARLALAELDYRRPSLDEAFLSLTGRQAVSPENPPGSPRVKSRWRMRRKG